MVLIYVVFVNNWKLITYRYHTYGPYATYLIYKIN